MVTFSKISYKNVAAVTERLIITIPIIAWPLTLSTSAHFAHRSAPSVKFLTVGFGYE